MFKFISLSQIWKKYIQKLNDWDLPLKRDLGLKIPSQLSTRLRVHL